MSDAFEVKDLGELLALQRVFREAKFRTEPDDIEVADSPVVARLFERLIATLIAREVERDGEDARVRWANWLAIDDSRDEWLAAVRRAKADNRWASLSPDARAEQARLLLSPFPMSPADIQKFILSVSPTTK